LNGVGAVSGAFELLGLNLIQALGVRMIAAQTRIQTCAHEQLYECVQCWGLRHGFNAFYLLRRDCNGD
jgi:hypothetical protein